MKLTATIIAVAAVALIASNASAQTNDHFARQRQSAARVAAAQDHLNHGHSAGHHFDVPTYRPGHWGGPTTHSRFYFPSNRQGVQFYSGNPYGYGFPGYGYYGGGYPYYCAPGGPSVYIHREIYYGR
jgi:hypothetical protein